MIGQGHSFSELKTYSLGQIGVFLRSAARSLREDKRERLRLAWYANHVTEKGLDSVMDAMGEVTEPVEADHDEDLKNWQEFASFFGGLG